MKLGDKVYFIDDCESRMYIRKGTITAVVNVHRYEDFLSSRPEKECTFTQYTVCAIKGSFMDYFEKLDNVFETIEALKDHLAEKEFKKYDLVE